MPLPFRILAAVLILFSCNESKAPGWKEVHIDSPISTTATTLQPGAQPITTIETGKTKPDELIAFARTLTGVPYKYGSTNPHEGFDCSGFITYTFNHFGIQVPRSSVDFTNVDKAIALKDVKPGDLILFTGTDSTQKVVGHMGILVMAAGDSISFIHSTSGKANGVTETPLNAYYQGRYMKAIRVFQQNN